MQEIFVDPGVWTTIEPTTVSVRWDGDTSQDVQYDPDTNAVYLPPFNPDIESNPLWNVRSGDAPVMRVGDIPEVLPDGPEGQWPGGFTVADGKWQMI